MANSDQSLIESQKVSRGRFTPQHSMAKRISGYELAT
jgi:hypothetical protein